jgi:hypothetical protein
MDRRTAPSISFVTPQLVYGYRAPDSAACLTLMWPKMSLKSGAIYYWTNEYTTESPVEAL